MDDLEKQMSKLDEMFEEGKNIGKPYIISHSQPLNDVSQDYIDHNISKDIDLETEYEERKRELIELRSKQEEHLFQALEKRTIRINTIKNLLGKINIKAIKKLKSKDNFKEEVHQIVEEFDESRKNEQNNDDNIKHCNCSKNLLITVPKAILFKINSIPKTEENDILFSLEKENEDITVSNSGPSRTLKKNGSIISSILITIITLSIGIIMALIIMQ